jgi:trypsin-like peptidase
MYMNPLAAVRLLLHIDQQEDLSFLGTCFAFRHPHYLLTAAHCVGELTETGLAVASPADIEGSSLLVNRVQVSQSIIKHPTADVAIVTVAEANADPAEAFWDCVSNYSLGEDFFAFGFPENVFGEHSRQPTPRLFKGYFQRFMEYQSYIGYKYKAGELNIPCPGGLSGGPLFRPGAPVMLTGLVTENHESTTFLHSVEEVLKDGNVIREHYQNVINYGVCLMLDSVKDWLDEHIPPRSSAAV